MIQNEQPGRPLSDIDALVCSIILGVFAVALGVLAQAEESGWAIPYWGSYTLCLVSCGWLWQDAFKPAK